MTIAAHIHHTDEHSSVYLVSCFTLLTKLHPEHRFIFFTEKKTAPFIQQENVQFINIFPSIKNNLLLHYWYNYKLPPLLQKFNADVFISDDATASLRTNIRQCMLVNDLKNIHHIMSTARGSGYAKRFFGKFLNKAEIIFTPSEYISNHLRQYFPLGAGKMHTIYHGLSKHFLPLSQQSKEKILDEHSGGYDYFFYEVTPHTSAALLPLLIAFSQFKKWQKSSFRLLLLYKGNVPEEPVPDFRNYKFKTEVILKSHSSAKEAAAMLAAAYAVIYLPTTYNAGFTGLHALRCVVPLISSNEDYCKSLFGNAATYCSTTADEIAKSLITVYKEEAGNKIKTQEGIELTKKYTWEHTANLLWIAMLPD